MADIGSSHIYDALNQLKNRFKSENIINLIQAFELLSNAIQELQVSLRRYLLSKRSLPKRPWIWPNSRWN
jgi:F0F1-type ATP synthase delta subunit